MRKRNKILTIIILSLILLICGLFLREYLVKATIYSNISGTIMCINTQKPVEEEIDVICVPSGVDEGVWYHGKSNKKGEFVIEMVPPGTYDFFIHDSSKKYKLQSIWALDPVKMTAQQLPMEKTITVPQGKNVTNIIFYVEWGSSVSGVVYKHDGVTPAEEAIVEISPNVMMVLRESEDQKTRTDANGKYRFDNLLGGMFFTLDVRIDEGYAFVSTQFESPCSGCEELKNLNIILGNPATILLGKVTSNGKPVVGAEITIGKNDCGDTVKTDKEGKYIVKGLKGGLYGIYVEAEGYEELHLYKENKIKIVEGIKNVLDLQLTPK